MAGVWTNTGEGWKLGAPQPFQDEATLHRLIADNPQMLPLAGSPDLTVLGSEVRLGNGYADILAVESSGRPVIIEVKLRSNPEARRAIVAQVLAYAAFLHGADVEDLQQGALSRALATAGYSSIAAAVQAQDQEGEVDVETFSASMQEFLDSGNFRIVLVLDDVSAELEKVIAYLDAVTIQAVTIDLITLKVYEVNGARIALPQRVSPDSGVTAPPAALGRTSQRPRPVRTDGTGAFRASIEEAGGEARKVFDDLIACAEQWATLPNVRVRSKSTRRPGEYSMIPRVMPGNAGIVTVWNSKLQPSVTVWPSVVKRLAPKALAVLEQAMGPLDTRKWNTTENITPELLEALTAAYREASGV